MTRRTKAMVHIRCVWLFALLKDFMRYGHELFPSADTIDETIPLVKRVRRKRSTNMTRICGKKCVAHHWAQKKDNLEILLYE